MTGTKLGGMKTAETNKKLYGEDFYIRIGKKGGQNSHTGGFAANPALASLAGAKGGRISRRGISANTTLRVQRIKKMIDAYESMSVSEIVEKYNYQYEDLLLDKAVRRILNERPEFVSVEGGRYAYEKS